MYGDLLDKYPVVSNSVWQFEKGLLVCGSNLNPENQNTIPLVDGVYTDPPWNLGNMNMFNRFAGRGRNDDFWGFIEGVLALVKSKSRVVACFDMGIKHGDAVVQLAEQMGYVVSFKSTTYYSKPPRPCYTVGGSFTMKLVMKPVDNYHGVAVIERVVQNLITVGASTMFDPCCGKLDFLVEGLHQGMDCVYGIELIPKKLALGLDRLTKLGYRVKRVK